MSARQLILLSPYRYPTQNSLVLGNDDMASWLNAYTALWHPAALWQAAGPPRFEVPYDHEQPAPGVVYVLPESPPLFLPDDWDARVQAAGATAFKAAASREQTLANLHQALANSPSAPPPGLLTAETDAVAPFFGVGLGHLLQATLAEAMEHENMLEPDKFWQDVQQAAAALAGLPYTPPPAPEQPEGAPPYPPPPDYEPPPEPPLHELPAAADGEPGPAWRRHLEAAANRLLTAREVLYPVAIHLLDLAVLDERKPDAPWPASFALGLPVNLVASGAALEALKREHPERLAALRERIAADQAEVCGGCYLEREDALLPVESQLWNLRKGLAVSRELLSRDVAVFARRRFLAHPQLPLFLSTNGLTRALLLSFDDAALPQYHSTVIGWPSPDGRQVDAFVRRPRPAESAETWFNLGHYLFKTTREDHVATLAFVHGAGPAAPWYEDFLALGRLGPIFGRWTTFSRYFGEGMAGEYTAPPSADEFHFDYLVERVPAEADAAPPMPCPVSGFAQQQRLRRRIDACWTLAALQRGLAGRGDPLRLDGRLAELEDEVEQAGASPPANGLTAALDEVEQQITGTLAERLLSRATESRPGYLVLNPCSFIRRVALELDGAGTPLPIGGPVKACQLDGDRLRVVVEVPALGFAWFPRQGPPGTPPMPTRMRLADERGVRNEFFEAEIDRASGGLRSIADRRTFVPRVGQRLVFYPGSVMQATSIKVTSSGPALGEVVTEGALKGDQGQVLARFRQRFRAWLGRPLLELRVELFPEQPAAGPPWHAYYGARFAWRDERATILRGINGTSYVTTHPRPQTPDFLDLRSGRQSTVLFPGGLPFHQRHESRMLDMILLPQGETTHVFDLGIGLDREYPMQTALGLTTPVPLIPTAKGPPHIGATGWLFHLDTPNLLLTAMRPGNQERPAPEGETPPEQADAVAARLLECSAVSGQAELRCPRNPRRAVLVDARGGRLVEPNVNGDAVHFEVSPGDFVQTQVEFS
jgi:hypothetical protein